MLMLFGRMSDWVIEWRLVGLVGRGASGHFQCVPGVRGNITGWFVFYIIKFNVFRPKDAIKIEDWATPTKQLTRANRLPGHWRRYAERSANGFFV